jgi:hypothetical protein
MKKKNYTVGKVPTFNRNKKIEIGKFDIHNTRIHDRSWLSSGTSMKSDRYTVNFSKAFLLLFHITFSYIIYSFQFCAQITLLTSISSIILNQRP